MNQTSLPPSGQGVTFSLTETSETSMSEQGWKLIIPQASWWRRAGSTFMLMVHPVLRQLIGWTPTFWQLAKWMWDVRRTKEYHQGDMVVTFFDPQFSIRRWTANR